MKKIDIKAEFKKLTYSKGTDSLRMELTPYRDWMFVVIVFFIVLSVSLGFNFFISSEANRDSFFSAAPKSVGVIKFDQTGLADVVSSIDNKAAQFEIVKTEEIKIVDPSRQDW